MFKKYIYSVFSLTVLKPSKFSPTNLSSIYQFTYNYTKLKISILLNNEKHYRKLNEKIVFKEELHSSQHFSVNFRNQLRFLAFHI